VGSATSLAALRADNPALVLPLVFWGAALVAASSCDAVSQRIPTALVRQSIVLVCLLLTSTSVLYEDWSGLVMSMVTAATSGLVLLLCWRVAGAGFGDVRLAVLGGLGLGHATDRGLLIGLAVLTLVVFVQATITLRRGGSLHTPLPMAPALSIGFVIAAVW
jgi:leader peptidase (prepilin peptidase)/N-methyltransferase